MYGVYRRKSLTVYQPIRQLHHAPCQRRGISGGVTSGVRGRGEGVGGGEGGISLESSDLVLHYAEVHRNASHRSNSRQKSRPGSEVPREEGVGPMLNSDYGTNRQTMHLRLIIVGATAPAAAAAAACSVSPRLSLFVSFFYSHICCCCDKPHEREYY